VVLYIQNHYCSREPLCPHGYSFQPYMYKAAAPDGPGAMKSYMYKILQALAQGVQNKGPQRD